MFLKLSEMGSGTPHFLNMALMERIAPEAAGGSLIFYHKESCAFHAKESPDEIMMLMATGTLNVDTR